VAASGVAHAAGWVEGRLPGPVGFAGFAIAGAVIGARFRGTTRAAFGAALGAALRITAIAIGIAAAAAAAMAPLLGLPFGQVMVAFAPGGVEAMAAMALALGYDPVYVGVHHVARIFALVVALPLVLARLGPPQPPAP
jgi:membrane AbrB-like protein